MILLAAQSVVVLFGVFLIGVGVLMLVRPVQARAMLRKAGSTNLINYAEITVRMIPAAGMIVFADASRFPDAFRVLGWFMIATSVVLWFVPRAMHYRYALWTAERLTPGRIRLISPFSVLFGGAVLYAVL